jgi:hypothetical protein
MVEENLQVVGVNALEGNSKNTLEEEEKTLTKPYYHKSIWYCNISYILTTIPCPKGINKSQRRSLKLII